MIEAGPPISAEFDVDSYLSRRSQDPSFVMVEVGHDSLPVAYNQPFEFTGQRAYIGVEAWLRDRYNVKQAKLAQLRAENDNSHNIFYISHNLGGVVLREEDGDWHETYYSGEYDAATVLPDGAADEVFASNVFCDPHVANSSRRTADLLAETSRLAGPGGTLVLRETITPSRVRYVTQELLDSLGLEIKATVLPEDTENWSKLEAVYKAEPATWKPLPLSFYLFLNKADKAKNSDQE